MIQILVKTLDFCFGLFVYLQRETSMDDKSLF